MISKSKKQTQKLAIRLAKRILRPTPYALRAKIIALQGELGSGKTTFVQGFMRGLCIKHHITSPTFIIYRKYQILRAGSQKITNYQLPITNYYIYHFDLYRIHKPKEILDLGFRKIIRNPANIVLIEWPEKIKKILPKNTIWVYFEHGKNKQERIIKISD
jgi:tRNA threonylcarbamoyladenosine biosynthesis protein TsaE